MLSLCAGFVFLRANSTFSISLTNVGHSVLPGLVGCVSLCVSLSLSLSLSVVAVAVAVAVAVVVVVVVVCAVWCSVVWCVERHAEKKNRVYVQNVPVCTGNTSTCAYTHVAERKEFSRASGVHRQ